MDFIPGYQDGDSPVADFQVFGSAYFACFVLEFNGLPAPDV